MAAGKRFTIATRDFARDLASSILFMNFIRSTGTTQGSSTGSCQAGYFSAPDMSAAFPVPEWFSGG